MKTPKIESMAQELALFQVQVLKRLDTLEKDTGSIVHINLSVLEDRIKELEDARKVQTKVNTELFNTAKVGDKIHITAKTVRGKPNFWQRYNPFI